MVSYSRFFLSLHFLIVFISVLFVFGFAPTAGANPSYDFAILNTGNIDDNIWPAEVHELKMYFDRMGWSHRDVSFDDINSGVLGGVTSATPRRFRALIMPGGFMAPRVIAINAAGNQNVRSFVEAGGGYVGFCAGAHQAARRLVLAYSAQTDNGRSHIPSEYRQVPYTLFGLLDATARAPYDWAPFSKGAVQEAVTINRRNPVMQAIHENHESSLSMLYLSGPVFQIDTAPEGYEVWAYAKAPRPVPSTNYGFLSHEGGSFAADGLPSIIKFNRGSGRVVLFSQHPVFNESNWNILEAALNVAVHQPPMRLTAIEIESRTKKNAGRLCPRLFESVSY